MISFRKANKQQDKLKYFSIPRFDKLTYLIDGVRENELITISARVGCGKTTLALNLFNELAKNNKCWYISYEMNNRELIDKIYRFCDKPNQDNMWFDDSCSTFDVDLIKRYIKQYGFKFIFIDYLQLMGGSIKKNTRALKEICRECNVVIFILAQLNRKAENNEPMLSMLKDSGSIEQDSDEVGFIKEHSIKVAKNRKGDVGEIDIEFNKPMSYFYETNEYNDKKEQLKEKFSQLCNEFLDCKEKIKIITFKHNQIVYGIDTYVLEFDEKLAQEFHNIFIDVIRLKTKLVGETAPKNIGVGIENIKLL